MRPKFLIDYFTQLDIDFPPHQQRQEPFVNNPSPWTAEFLIDTTLAKALVEEQFPTLRPASLELIGEGWDNLVFRVNQDFLFRFPRRKLGVDLIQNEAVLLPKIQPRLPLPIPHVLFQGQPSEQYPWPFLGYRYLTGVTACKAHLNSEERHQLAPVLGKFLKSLHEISDSEATASGAIPDTLGRLDLEKRIPATLDYLNQAKALGLVENLDPYLSIVEQTRSLKGKPLSSRPKSLVHGDLYIRHLMIDSNRTLCGVIDWGDIHVGDPALDLQVVFTVLPKETHPAFFAAYGTVSNETWLLARLRGLFSTCVTTVYANSIGDQDLLTEGKLSLQYLAKLETK